MKRLSTVLAAATLLALAACGSRSANNSAAIDTSNDVYNVSPDDLTLNDMGNGSMNASSGGNVSSSGNMSSGNSSASGNSHASGGNSASSHAAGNSH
jgi:hypothetical protein